MMKLIQDYGEFCKRTGPLRDPFDLDLQPDLGLGMFSPNRLDELVQYCRDHSDFHIMTVLPFVVRVNRAVPTPYGYLLAVGDPDPYLWSCLEFSSDLYVDLEIKEFDRD